MNGRAGFKVGSAYGKAPVCPSNGLRQAKYGTIPYVVLQHRQDRRSKIEDTEEGK